jgi:hypothetical protein
MGVQTTIKVMAHNNSQIMKLIMAIIWGKAGLKQELEII